MSKDKNNERLEFLGDAVLELVTSNYLYRTYQKESEGKLSKIRRVLYVSRHLQDVQEISTLGNMFS